MLWWNRKKLCLRRNRKGSTACVTSRFVPHETRGRVHRPLRHSSTAINTRPTTYGLRYTRHEWHGWRQRFRWRCRQQCCTSWEMRWCLSWYRKHAKGDNHHTGVYLVLSKTLLRLQCLRHLVLAEPCRCTYYHRIARYATYTVVEHCFWTYCHRVVRCAILERGCGGRDSVLERTTRSHSRRWRRNLWNTRLKVVNNYHDYWSTSSCRVDCVDFNQLMC